MMNPITMMMAVKTVDDDRCAQLLAEAQLRRALEGGRSAPGLRDRLCLTLGDILIASGRRLQQQAKPAVYSSPHTHQSPC